MVKKYSAVQLPVFPDNGGDEMKSGTNTKIHTKKWLDWNVGKGCRFKNLKELLEELKSIKKTFGNHCGFAGGMIIDEIELVKNMIGQNRGR